MCQVLPKASDPTYDLLSPKERKRKRRKARKNLRRALHGARRNLLEGSVSWAGERAAWMLHASVRVARFQSDVMMDKDKNKRKASQRRGARYMEVSSSSSSGMCSLSQCRVVCCLNAAIVKAPAAELRTYSIRGRFVAAWTSQAALQLSTAVAFTVCDIVAGAARDVQQAS